MSLREHASPIPVLERPSLHTGRQARHGGEFAGPAPCDGCPKSARCASARTACEAFVMFARGAAPVRWRLAPRVATVAIFGAVFAEEGAPVRCRCRRNARKQLPQKYRPGIRLGLAIGG